MALTNEEYTTELIKDYLSFKIHTGITYNFIYNIWFKLDIKRKRISIKTSGRKNIKRRTFYLPFKHNRLSIKLRDDFLP